MAKLHHMSHDHPLVFNQDTSSPSDTTYDCAGCAGKVSGSSYSCGDCGFYLHKRCAEAPLEIQHHPVHGECDHPLLLLSHPPPRKRCAQCFICGFKVKGFGYCCSYCDFCLDVNCALLPRHTTTKFIQTVHQHPLFTTHSLASLHPILSFECEGCLQPIEKDDSSYFCLECRKFFHKTCRELPPLTLCYHEHRPTFFNPHSDLLCSGCLDPIEIHDSPYTCFYCTKFYHKKCLEVPSTINHPCHRTHQLSLVYDYDVNFDECSLCERGCTMGFFYRCVPCRFNIHLRCAWPPPVIEDKSRHEHPFNLLLKPNNPFFCDACGNQGDNVSYICSTCNIQVHKDCISLPHHIRLCLHPHPISHCFFLCIDHDDSRTWDCRICYTKVNIEHGSYYCSRPGCDFIIHVECSIQNKELYGIVEVENPDDFEELDLLSDESTSCIIRVIKEIKVGDDVIAEEIEHISHKHNLIFSDEIKDNKYCNGCVLPILSSFYYCSHCDFFLHKACAELRRMRQLWFDTRVFNLSTNGYGYFGCKFCRQMCSGFSYKIDEDNDYDYAYMCLRCASIPHSFTYHADEPHFLFFVGDYRGESCNSCGKDLYRERTYRCKDCTFALDWKCVTLPRTARHKCDRHSLTLAYQDSDDYPLRHYCDICEEERDSEQWFYSCQTCDKAMHIICVLGKFPFIKAGTEYAHEGHPHPLTFVKKIYYYPECILCGEPCEDLALECAEHGCKYIVHWTCTRSFHMNYHQ